MPKLLRWACPLCSDVKLAPSRPRKNDTRRYCLRCSEEKGRLVERVSPKLEAKREAKKQAQAKKRRAKHEFKPPEGYYVVGGVNLTEMHLFPLDPSETRVRTTKGPGPVLRKPDGIYVFRKGDWADKYDAWAQTYVARALAHWWRVNKSVDETLRLKAYLREFVEVVGGGVRPRLEGGLKDAPREVAELLRKKAAVEVLSKPGLPLARQA